MNLSSILPSVKKLSTSTLFVGREAESVLVSGGRRIDLRAHGPIRHVLQMLLDAHRLSPGRSCSLDEIFAAAWPSEQQMTREVRRNRVYTAISRLRTMGLGALLQRSVNGYYLDPTCCVIAEGAPAPRRSLEAEVWNGVRGWRAA